MSKSRKICSHPLKRKIADYSNKIGLYTEKNYGLREETDDMECTSTEDTRSQNLENPFAPGGNIGLSMKQEIFIHYDEEKVA